MTLATVTSNEGEVMITSTAGAVLDNSGDAVNVTAASLVMDTANGVGSSGNSLETMVEAINAVNDANSLNINNTGDLSVAALISDGDVTLDNTGTVTLSPVEGATFDRSADNISRQSVSNRFR